MTRAAHVLPLAPDARPVHRRPACSPHGVVDVPGASGAFSVDAIDHELSIAFVRFDGAAYRVVLDRDEGRWYFPTHLASYAALPDAIVEALETDAAQERLAEIDCADKDDARNHDWMV